MLSFIHELECVTGQTCLLELSPSVRCAACQAEKLHIEVKPCYCQHADGVFTETLTLERKSETLDAFVFLVSAPPHHHVKHSPRWAILLKTVYCGSRRSLSSVWLVFRVLTLGNSNKSGIHQLYDGSEASIVALILTWMVLHWELGLWAGRISAG